MPASITIWGCSLFSCFLEPGLLHPYQSLLAVVIPGTLPLLTNRVSPIIIHARIPHPSLTFCLETREGAQAFFLIMHRHIYEYSHSSNWTYFQHKIDVLCCMSLSHIGHFDKVGDLSGIDAITQ